MRCRQWRAIDDAGGGRRGSPLSLLGRYWPFGLHRRLSPSSDVRGRVNTSPPEASDAGDGKEGKSAGAAGCSMKQAGNRLDFQLKPESGLSFTNPDILLVSIEYSETKASFYGTSLSIASGHYSL